MLAFAVLAQLRTTAKTISDQTDRATKLRDMIISPSLAGKKHACRSVQEVPETLWKKQPGRFITLISILDLPRSLAPHGNKHLGRFVSVAQLTVSQLIATGGKAACRVDDFPAGGGNQVEPLRESSIYGSTLLSTW
jgi:hypothetical protein